MTKEAYRLKNIACALTLKGTYEKGGRNLLEQDLNAIQQASIVCSEKEILWVGQEKNLPDQYRSIKSHDCQNTLVTPELIDCHTHLVFAGKRSHEYSMRLKGATYQEIAQNGGGILYTVEKTNQSSLEELFDLAKDRCQRLHLHGIGTIEIKSGYGLNYDREYQLSHLIHKLKKQLAPKINIHNTFMAAHAVPKEYSSSNQYLKKIVMPLLRDLHRENIIDSVDIFYEQNYFSKEDVRELFDLTLKLNLPRRLHADEFYDNKGAILACEYGALSVDHLLQTDSDGIEALANSQTIATLLPGTCFFLGKKQANARKFLDRGCRLAIGSDYNPGSCHFDNLLQIAAMAAPQYQMNLGELWAAITLNAAGALGLDDQGAIVPGLKPRFSFF